MQSCLNKCKPNLTGYERNYIEIWHQATNYRMLYSFTEKKENLVLTTIMTQMAEKSLYNVLDSSKVYQSNVEEVYRYRTDTNKLIWQV